MLLLKVDEDITARCETVLNITMAEMDTYHAQKVEDFQTLTKEHLDGEIAFYEQVLSHPHDISVSHSFYGQVLQRLRAARRTFDSPAYDSLSENPRSPSMYERELENPRLTQKPLPQPCPHVFDSAPMRPVSVAIQEGVGMFLGGSRGSVFGKFW
jgi:sorting nexin-9/18/33